MISHILTEVPTFSYNYGAFPILWLVQKPVPVNGKINKK